MASSRSGRAGEPSSSHRRAAALAPFAQVRDGWIIDLCPRPPAASRGAIFPVLPTYPAVESAMVTAVVARIFTIPRRIARGAVLAALGICLAACSACGPAASAPPREVPRLERPAFDPRRLPADADRTR